MDFSGTLTLVEANFAKVLTDLFKNISISPSNGFRLYQKLILGYC